VTENDSKVISAAVEMFYVCIDTEIASISVSVAKLLVLPVWGYCFYFRFAPDSVVQSRRTMSILVEGDRASPKSLPEPLRSP